MTIIIDRLAAESLIRAAIAEKGEQHIGRSEQGGCSYYEHERHARQNYETIPLRQEDGRAIPSCLIGNCLDRLGFDTALMEEGALVDIATEADDPERVTLRGRGGTNAPLTNSQGEAVELTEEAFHLWCNVQSWQDSGEPWGRALTWGLSGFNYHG